MALGRRRVRRTLQQLFLDALEANWDSDSKLLNARSLQETLKWDNEKFARVRRQLTEENQIVTVRGGPGGAIGLANAANSAALNVFISYSHADSALKDRLVQHLTPLKRLNLIAEWHDGKIEPGDKWAETISENVEKAHIILLLISIDFINSKYCYDIEMDRALERNFEVGCSVIPVILRSCFWQHSPFASLQALPKDAKPVASWADIDEAFVSVVDGIKTVAERLKNS